MFKTQRHNEIIEILTEERFVSVPSLSKRLYVSMPTIRRDLTFLEDCGYIKRSHGGAILAEQNTNVPLPFRQGKKSNEKIKMCKLASTLIKDGSIIFTDASSTVLHIADKLEEYENITVVTNGLKFADRISGGNTNVFATGGKILKTSLSFSGTRAVDFISDFSADIMFFSSSALTKGGAITDYSEEETLIRKKMMSNSATKVFMCDSSKFYLNSAFNLCSLSDVDYIITDVPLPDDILTNDMFDMTEGDGAIMYTKKI